MLSKSVLITDSTKLPESIFAYNERAPTSKTEEALVHKQKRPRMQIERHKQVATDDENKMTDKCRQEIQTHDKFEGYVEKRFKMMKWFEKIWNVLLKQVSIAKYRIIKVPRPGPMHCAPFRAKVNPRKFAKSEINTMLRMKEVEPAKTEWAAPNLFAPKADGLFQFHLP